MYIWSKGAMNGTDYLTTQSKLILAKTRPPLFSYKEDLASLWLKMTLAPKLALARSTR